MDSTLQNKYSLQVIWLEEDQEYVVLCPEFPGLSVFGKDAGKALEEAREVLAAFIESLLKDGQELPLPRKLQDYSGNTRLRMPRTLHRQLASLAEYEGVSLNSLLLQLVSLGLGLRVAEKRTSSVTVNIEKVVYTTGMEVDGEVGPYQSEELNKIVALNEAIGTDNA